MSVVKLSEFTGSEPAPESPRILRECRDIVMDKLCASIDGALDRVEGELLKKLESTAMSAEDQRLYGEVQRQLRLIKSDLEQRFRAVFQRGFNLRAAGAPPGRDVYRPDSDAPLELTLLDMDAHCEQVTVEKLAARLQDSCDEQLSELGPRLAYLMGREESDPARDPMSPEAISGVLKDLCWQIDSPSSVKLIILDRLGGNLGEDLARVYRELNAHLVARNVLPELRRALRRRRALETPAPGAAPAAAHAAAQGDVLAELQQLMARHGAAAKAGEDTMPLDATSLMAALTRVQHGDTSPANGLDALLQDGAQAGLDNVLRALQGSDLGRQLGSFDSLMIDIVATLFDHIFDDRRIPAGMKGLIGRLQIPILKVAMIDRGFFSSKSHPARRLLNALAGAAADWEGGFGPGDALHDKAEALVARIQAEFEEDIGLIAESLAEFEAFVASEECAAQARAAGFADELERRERQEIALAMAQGVAECYASDVQLPAAVREFATTHWVPVMAEAYQRGGSEAAPWLGALATLADLAWSVQPKCGAEARKLLVQRLPILLKNLRAGLDAADTPAAQREAFFSHLVALHAAAVKAGMAGGGAVRRQAPVQPPAAIPAAPGLPAAPLIDGLCRGDWLEFGEAFAEPLRVRLAWISPARSMYLFTNRQGQRALALTRSELAQRFDTGTARRADDTPLIDRVVETVLENIRVDEYVES